MLRSVVYPYDYDNDRMVLSNAGKYVLKLYFNGCWRRVEIDDLLPSSKTGRVLYVIDRRHPRLLWPALVEKAYLKIRGGYDFPGSNSGTDLAVLTGWIPQQVFLHDHEVEPDLLWEEVVKHFQKGNVLITLGTGKLPRHEQRQLGLAAEHDYAVLDIASNGDTKEMLIKNPWADGDVWKGAARRRQNSSNEGFQDDVQDVEVMMPGTFWMDLKSVFQYFENMYLNWSPGLFSHRQDLHFSWKPDQAIMVGNLIVDNPQFAITVSEPGEIWLLLHRHFRTGDYTEATIGKNGYISLYLYDRGGKRLISNEAAMIRGAFVDSPNTLIRFRANARTTYTAVLVSQNLPAGKLNFTISSFGKSSVTLKEADAEYAQTFAQRSAWTRSNAGGNTDSPRYYSNPQFRLSLSAAQKIALVLHVFEPRAKDEVQTATRSSDISVKVLVVFSDGSRITRLRPRDVLANSGDYRRGGTFIEAELNANDYTIICSTFESDQYATFCLDLHFSSTSAQQPLVQLSAEGSGRLSLKSMPAFFNNSTHRLLAPLQVLRMSRATFVARHRASAASPAQMSLFKMTLERGQGPYKEIIATSGNEKEEFATISSGLRLDDSDLQPSMSAPGTGGLWLVLERLAQGSGLDNSEHGPAGGRDEILEVEMFVDERIVLGAWGRGDG